MPDTERSDRRWWQYRRNQAGLVLLLLVVWALAAQQWQDKDCGGAQSYGLVVTHFGTPDHFEGCEDEPDGPVYTDDYAG